jgi:hypothetical protein
VVSLLFVSPALARKVMVRKGCAYQK